MDRSLAAALLTVSVLASGPAAGVTGTTFYPLTPCRALDTRYPDGPLGGPNLQPGVPRIFVVPPVCGVPSNAVAISTNATVTNPSGPGSFVTYPGDQSAPGTFNQSFRAGQTRAIQVMIELAADGSFGVLSSGAAADFILDVNGYFAAVPGPGIVTLDPVSDQTIPTNTTLSLRLSGHSTDALASLTYGLVSGPTGAAVSPLGVFAFAPSQSQMGTTPVTVRVRDGSGQTAQASFNITVLDHDHPPAFGPLPDDVTSVGAPYAKTLTATDPDPGDVLTFSLVSGPAGMSLSGGTLSWSPTSAQTGSWPVRVTVTDRAGLSASSLFHVAIPLLLAKDDAYAVNVGKTLTIAAPGVLANDADPLPGPPTAAKLTNPDKGSLTAFNADGSFVFQAPPTLDPVPFAPAGKYAHASGGYFNGGALIADLDGDGKPEIVIQALLGTGNFGIRAIRGTDGSVLWERPSMPASAADCTMGQLTGGRQYYLAVGDIDDSGNVSVVFPTTCGRDAAGYGGYAGIIVARYAALNGMDGSLKWLSQPLGKTLDASGNADNLAFGTVPTIARVRAGETPSIVVGRDISFFSFAGKPECDQAVPGWPNGPCRAVFVLDGKDGSVRQSMGVWHPGTVSPDQTSYSNGYLPALAADLDGDGSMEFVFGGAVFNNDGSVRSNRQDTSTRFMTHGIALGNFDDTPDIEIVRLEDYSNNVVSPRISVSKGDGTVLWATPLWNGNIGPLVVADVDGTGRPSVVFVANTTVCAIGYDGVYKWCYDGGTTGGNPNFPLFTRPQVFDLDGDGVPEVIVQVNPESLLYLDGKTGSVKALQDLHAELGSPSTDYRGDELGGPLVADLDGTGRAAIVSPWQGGLSPGRVDVVTAQADGWSLAPGIFNQMAYQPGSVNANGSIPATFQNAFATPSTNVFAAQAPLAPADARKKSTTSFTYAAHDGALTSPPATVSIEILPANRPPAFVSKPPTRFVVNTGLSYAASAVDPDPGDTVTYAISTNQGSGSCSIGASTGLLSCPILNGGDHSIVLSATDPFGGIGFQTLLLTPSTGPAAVPDVVGRTEAGADSTLAAAGFSAGAVSTIAHSAPAGEVVQQSPAAGTQLLLGSSVNLVLSRGPVPPTPIGPSPGLGNLQRLVVTPGATTRAAGENAVFKAVSVNTDGTGADVTAFVTWSSSAPAVAIVSGGAAHAVAPGTATIMATANGLSGAATLTVSARSNGDFVPPVALLTQPASGGTVTGLTQIVGTATDAHFLRYELALQASGAPAFTVFAQGSAPVSSGVLGTLDPTLLLNGAYVLRLTVYDANGNTATADAPFVADGAMKVGAFTLSYTDMTVALSGIPIQITRTYDSRDKGTGDFGAGWRLGIQALRVTASGSQGSSWFVQKQGFSYVLVPGSDHFVSVTLPNGRVETFDLQVSPSASPFVPFTTLSATFVPRAGTQGRITSLDNVNLLIVEPQPGPVTLLDDTTLATFHPDRFLYTQRDGTQFVVRRTTGMESVADTNGNKITLTAGGISHSSGVAIAFARDGQGRITGITDPNGATRTYVYSATGNLDTTTDRTGNTSRYFYDAAHGLVRVEDALSRAGVRCTYDDAGRLVSITDGAGATTTYTHDLPGRAEQIVDALGRTTILAYDDRGNTLSATDPLGRTTFFTYDDANNPLSRTSALGHLTTFEWDGSNDLLKTTDPLGRSAAFTRDAAGRPLTATDARGHATTSAYDAAGNLTDVVDRLGGARHYDRDASGNVTGLTTPTGATSQNIYDIAGRRTTLTGPLGGATQFQWDGNGNLKSQSPPQGATTTLTYDGDGRVTLHTVGTLQRAFAYDATGQVASMTSPTGTSSGVGFDDAGRFASVSQAGGAAALTLTYDAVGNAVSAAGPLGNAETRVYDASNQLVSRTRADGTAETRTYDAGGRLTSVTDALGHATTYAYDAAGQLVQSTNALGGTSAYTYDANGNLASETDASGRTTLHAYDAENREVLTTYADGTTEATAYDADGRVTSRTDAGGAVTAFTYDAAGRVTAVTDALGHVTTHAFSPSGARLATTDANGHVTSYTYDAAGRLLTATRPLGGVETRTYDPTGRLATLANAAGETLTRTYDARGRHVQTIRPGGLTESYTYTPDQLADSVRDASGTTVFLWEPLTRRLARVTQPDGRYVRYAYDAVGNRTLVATGSQISAERVTTYTYDALGHVVAVHDPDGGTTTETWDAVGNLLTVLRPNGVKTTTTYDVRNRPVLIVSRDASNALLQQHAYTLDARGNRARVDAFDGSHVDYTYDALSRLTREKHYDASNALQLDLVYGYDAVGNLVTSGPAASPASFGFDADDRLASGGGVTYTYDLAGRRTQESFLQGGNPVTRKYAWAAGDRLASFTDTTAATTAYTYDGAELRTGKSGATGPVTFLADRIDPSSVPQLLAVTSLSGTSTFLRDGRILKTVEGATPRFHLLDGLGSTRFLTSAAGAVTDTFDYAAYGRLLSHTGPAAVPHRFAGEEFDAESGLVYLRARYFDPATGAFLSRDPEPGDPSDPITLHPYLYAAGNPVNRTDPTGRETLAEVMVVSQEQLRVQGQNVLAVRRGLAKAEQVVAETLRVEGGVLAVEAFLEAVQDSTRVTNWFGGGRAGKMLGRLLAGGSDIIGESIDIAAEVLMAKVAFDMLGGRSVNIGIQGIGFLTSSTVSATATALQGPTAATGCSGNAGFLAFAYKDATPPGLELCSGFFGLPMLPTVETLTNPQRPSAAGVMIHEFTHITLRTRDHSYGCGFMKAASGTAKDITFKYLQRNLPGANLFNADTYRCWAEDAYVSYTNSPWKLP